MDNGLGAPGMNPPLAGTEIVNGDPSKLIDIVLTGFKEPTVINGELYQNVMPAQAFLTDQQIADVLTFVRSSFGNSAGPVSAEAVSRKRIPNP
jgi:mono/diheme cytochrome c family protein